MDTSRTENSAAAPWLSAIKENRIKAILLAAVLTTVLLFFLVRIPDLTRDEVTRITVEEGQGVYDLTEIAEWKETEVFLPPGSFYFPNTYLEPETADRGTPVSTEVHEEIRADYLTQRFVVELPDTDDVYSLYFKLSGRHAFKVYINGESAGQRGNPGITKGETEIIENNFTCYGTPKNGQMDILLHTAQFYHYKRGASLATLSLHKTAEAPGSGFSSHSKGFLLMGALFCASLFLLFLFLLQKQNRSTLYFAFACLAMLLREAQQSQAWTEMSFLPGNLSFMLEYLSMTLLTIFLSLYLRPYALGGILNAFRLTAFWGSALYTACLLLTDSIFYTSILIYYQVLLVGCIVPGIAGVFRAIRRPDGEQSVALYGMAVFYLAAVSDILMYNDVFVSFLSDASISEAAMLIFVMAQTLSLFLMNNRLIAEGKEKERKLSLEKAALESLNRMKTEFLGNVSHELKTPLTVVSGYAQTTKQLAETQGGPEGAEVSRRMRLISSEAERLSLMVGQILDVTRMEEGRMIMERTSCHLDEVIHTAVETHYPMLNKNENRLEIRIETGLPAVWADPGRISQVIVNLISNAVRFTAKGLIVVSAELAEGYVRVRVSDTGAGMSKEQLAGLFKRYGGKRKSGTGQDTGTGLGLYICKHIVESHEGKIWVESEEGQGTGVFFTLPLGDSNKD